MVFALVGAVAPSIIGAQALGKIAGFFVLPVSFVVSVLIWYFSTVFVAIFAFVWKKLKPENDLVEKNVGRSSYSLLVTAPLIAIFLGFIVALLSHKFLVTWLVYAGLGLMQGVCIFGLAKLRLLSLDDLFADD